MKMFLFLFGITVLLGVTCSSDTDVVSTPSQNPTSLSTETPIASVKSLTNEDALTSGVNESTHDVDCMVPILGRQLTDDIVYRNRLATDQELVDIMHCKLHIDSNTHSPTGRQQGTGSASSPEQQQGTRQGTSNKKDECDNQGICDNDQNDSYDSSGYTYTCHGFDQDNHGMPTGPQCNLISPPLSIGVTQATLVEISLPKPKYQTPVESCQTFAHGKCAELQWSLVSDVQAGEFTAIEISLTNPDLMYAAVDSNDMSLYRSLDGGISWDLVHIAGHAAGIAISPINSNNAIYTNLETAVYQTLDTGNSWGDVVGGLAGTGDVQPWTAIAFSKDNPKLVYTTALRGSSRGGIWPAEPSDVFKSSDEGKTWVKVGTCDLCSSVQTIVVTEGDPNFLWVAADGGLLFSKDGGGTWSTNVISYLDEQVSNPENLRRHQPPKVVGLAAQPGNPKVMLAASSEHGMFRSNDGGSSWARSNDGLTPSKLHRVQFSNSNPNVAYVTSHDGVFRSDDAGESWTERNDGLLDKFVSPIAIHPSNEDIAFVGTSNEIYTIHPEHQRRGLYEGGGLYKTVDGGKNWVRSDSGIVEAKIAQIGTHPLFPFNLWVGGESGRGNFYSPDGGNSWLFSGSMTAHYPMVYAFSYDLPTMMWATGWQVSGELAGSTNGGANWFTRTEELNKGLSAKTKELGLRTEGPNDFHIHGVAVAPSDSNVIYVGSVHDSVYTDLQFNLDGAHIFKSSDGGLTFPEMSNGFPIETETSINSIVVHPRDPDTAYAMTSLHETTTAIGIYKTTDGAQSWIAVNDGLDPYTNDLQIDPITPEILYAATESGIFKTVDGAKTWKKASKGIPKGPVIDMAIDPLNPIVLYAITPEDIYRTQNGADNWYSVNLGIPLLEDSSKTLSVQDRLLNQLAMDRTKTGHSMYGGTFAQDRTLEIDATGRVIVVAVKTGRDDKDKRNERMLYRALLNPLAEVAYEFSIDSPEMDIVDARVKVRSQSNIYDMFFDSNIKEITFTVSGPTNTNSTTTIEIPNALLSRDSHAPDCCIKVFLDGVQVSSSSTSEGIIFEYFHVGRSEVLIKTM